MRILFFDTETTGLWNFRAGVGHICQPDIVQFCGVLMDGDTQDEIQVMNLVVTPTKLIEPQAAEIHGITQEIAERFGVPRRLAVSNFHHLVKQSDLVVAHNSDFDTRVLSHAYAMEGLQTPAFPTFCTMKASTDICQIPHANPHRGNSSPFKWPKLIEAYKILVDEAGFEGAHDALIDARACAKVFFALQDRGLVRL